MQNSDISYLLEIQKLENKIGEYVKSIDSHSSRTKTLEKQISSKKNSLQEVEQKTKLQKVEPESQSQKDSLHLKNATDGKDIPIGE